MPGRDYHALFPASWVRSGVVLSPSTQSQFLAANYSLVILGAGMGTTRVQELRQAVTDAGLTQEQAWYTKACGLHDPGAAPEDETSYGWATMLARNALSRVSYPAGSAVFNRWNGWRYVDIIDNEGSGNNAAWVTSQNALLDSMQARVDVDGVYLDNSSVMIVTGSNSFTVDSLGNAATPGGYTDTAWYTGIKAIVDGVVSGQTGKHVWFNSYTGFGVVGERGLSLLQNSYGMFSEGFAAKIDGTTSPGYWTRSRFKQQVNDVVTALASYGGRRVVVIDDVDPADTQRRFFKLGAYLLAFNNTTRLKEITRVPGSATDLHYAPEYDAAITQLGTASGAYADDGTFLTRTFAGGRVIVNPDTSAHTYTLPSGVWEMLEASGVTALGAGSAFWSGTSASMSLPAHSALVIRQVGGLTRYTITSATPPTTRYYSLYLPSPLPTGKIPLLVVLHGGATNSDFVRTQTAMNTKADAEGFAVAYPDGTPDGTNEYWNAWGGSPSSSVEDVIFLKNLTADAASRTPIDRARVYCVGFSNGGKMAHRLADQYGGGVFAAVGAHSGGITTLDNPGEQACPIIHIHGAADIVVPYAGGAGIPGEAYPNLAIETVVMPFWATRNGGTLTPTTTSNTGYDIIDFTDAGTATKLYKVTALGHEWAKTADGDAIQANDVFWAFFSPFYVRPTAALTATPTSGNATLTVALDASGSISLNDTLSTDTPVEYSFDFGEGGGFEAYQSDATVSHDYTTGGSFTAQVKVRDDAGHESLAATVAITVTGNPVATLSASPSTGEVPLEVTLTASATGGTGPYTYSFDYGEGAGYGAYTSSPQTHTYSTPGTYTARVKAKDSLAAVSAAATATVYASTVAAPTLTFTADRYTARRFQKVVLTWTSTNCVSMRRGGDWGGTTTVNGTFNYYPYRTKTFTLTGTNSAGVTVTKQVKIVLSASAPKTSFLGVRPRRG